MSRSRLPLVRSSHCATQSRHVQRPAREADAAAGQAVHRGLQRAVDQGRTDGHRRCYAADDSRHARWPKAECRSGQQDARCQDKEQEKQEIKTSGAPFINIVFGFIFLFQAF